MASRIRNGRRRPSVRVMNAINEAYGVPLDKLMEAHEQGSAVFGTLIQRTLIDAAARNEYASAA